MTNASAYILVIPKDRENVNDRRGPPESWGWKFLMEKDILVFFQAFQFSSSECVNVEYLK